MGFTKPIETVVETVARDSHLKSTELRLVELVKECEQIEEAFNETFRALAEHDAYRMRLVAEQLRVAARRKILFEERIALLRELGRIT